MVSKKLYLLRHGDTGFSGRYIGTTDVSLTQSGQDEIARAAKSLSTRGIKKIFCSPMLRCRQSVERLSLDCPVEFSPLLTEVDFGRWEKKSFAEIVELDQVLIDQWALEYATFSFPEGEAIQAFIDRLAQFVIYLATQQEDITLVVAHGGVIRHLLCLLLALPCEKYGLFDVKTGRYCSLDLFPEGAALTGFNL